MVRVTVTADESLPNCNVNDPVKSLLRVMRICASRIPEFATENARAESRSPSVDALKK